jgi:hypothetical protein
MFYLRAALQPIGPLLAARIDFPRILFGDLAADLNIPSRRVEIKAAVVMPPMFALANEAIRIGVLDAARHAAAVVANFAADPFGICGVRQDEPKGSCRHTNEEFGHGQPPLRPRGQPRLRPALSITGGTVWFRT